MASCLLPRFPVSLQRAATLGNQIVTPSLPQPTKSRQARNGLLLLCISKGGALGLGDDDGGACCWGSRLRIRDVA